MKHLKILGLAAVAAMAMLAFAAGSASATTLEVTGSTTNAEVTISASLASGTSAILKDTFGISQNTCTTSNAHGTTSSPFTGTSVTGAFTGHGTSEPENGLSFANCTRTVVVHDPGTLEVTWTSGTNGTVASENAIVTVGSPVGTLKCETGATTKIGTLTGVSSGNATLDVNAVIACSGVGTAKWEGTYTVTSPHALGVSP